MRLAVLCGLPSLAKGVIQRDAAANASFDA
jgi:hypothetical protein